MGWGLLESQVKISIPLNKKTVASKVKVDSNLSCSRSKNADSKFLQKQKDTMCTNTKVGLKLSPKGNPKVASKISFQRINKAQSKVSPKEKEIKRKFLTQVKKNLQIYIIQMKYKVLSYSVTSRKNKHMNHSIDMYEATIQESVHTLRIGAYNMSKELVRTTKWRICALDSAKDRSDQTNR